MLPSNNTSSCPLIIYQEEIFKEFKDLFHKCLSQKSMINFDLLIKDCLSTAGIDTYQDENLGPFRHWFENIFELTFLKDFIENESIDEVILHSDGVVQTIGKNSQLHQLSISKADIQLALEVLVHKSQRLWNYSSPFCSFYSKLFQIPARLTLTHFSCSALSASKLFIRKHKITPLPLEAFALSPEDSSFFEQLIFKRKNILITGSTGSGKTSMLKTMLSFVPSKEHIVCIEDTFEIYPQSPFHTSLLANDTPGKTLKDYCSYAMRMSPQRLILGEIRSHEIVPFLLCLNTGHSGVMASTHANCAREGLERLALLYVMYSSNGDVNYPTILELLARNIDYVIHMENKKVKEIIEVYSAEGNNLHFETCFNAQITDDEFSSALHH